jgi:hypothetical protein
MPPKSRPATTKTTQRNHNQATTKNDHKTEGGSAGVDDEAIALWDDTCAAMPLRARQLSRPSPSLCAASTDDAPNGKPHPTRLSPSVWCVGIPEIR